VPSGWIFPSTPETHDTYVRVLVTDFMWKNKMNKYLKPCDCSKLTFDMISYSMSVKKVIRVKEHEMDSSETVNHDHF